MKILYLLFVFLLGCSSIYYPDDFIISLKFEGNIIDLEKEGINSKEELIDLHYNNFGNMILKNNDDKIDKKIIVYINPLCNNKLILDNNYYKAGMPVSLTIKRYNANLPIAAYSDQPVVLIKGHPEWADSSYEYNGEKFTILPVCDSNEDNGELRFTYTIKK